MHGHLKPGSPLTSSHLQAIKLRYPGLETPVHRFREWMPSGSREVPDPCGGPLDIYIETRDSLAEAIPSLLTYIKNHFEA